MSPAGFGVGFFDPDSVDVAGHGVLGMPAGRSVVGRAAIASAEWRWRRFVVEVTDQEPAFAQVGPVVSEGLAAAGVTGTALTLAGIAAQVAADITGVALDW
jgi:hypothetical protein